MAEATHRSVDVAERVVVQTVPSWAPALPEPGEIRFNIPTYDGRRTVLVRDELVQDRSHSLHALFDAGHGVITQLRLLDTTPPGR